MHIFYLMIKVRRIYSCQSTQCFDDDSDYNYDAVADSWCDDSETSYKVLY